ncbi:MAG: thioredoxin domain-containing protein [Bacteroidales bacterium]
MKKIICIVFMLVSLNLVAQEGIKFQHGTWAQAKELAVKENKLIFVDFYTQWCGPCYNMAKNTFVLYSVGTLYNTNFVNMKIDAENGEGIELAKKYGVRSYPTYCFIDPKTEEIVHRSSSNQAPDTFIFRKSARCRE